MTFCNTTAKKQQNVEFYNYVQHFRKYGLAWEHSAFEFKYSVEFSKDKNKLMRKMTMGKNTRMWNMEQPVEKMVVLEAC